MPQMGGFTNARCTQTLVLLTVAASLLAGNLPANAPQAYALPHPGTPLTASAARLLRRQRLELWRWPLSQLVAPHAGELAFDAYLLYHFRMIERQQGSRNYAIHVVAAATLTVLTLTALTEASWAVVDALADAPQANYVRRALVAFLSTGPYATGPLALVGAALARYQRHIPPTSRFRIFGWPQELTDKAFIALAAAQVGLARGGASLLPMGLGFFFGAALCEAEEAAAQPPPQPTTRA